MGAPYEERDRASNGDSEANPALWDPVYEYPVPLLVRNTFFEVMARSPSFDEFMNERKVQSSPAAYEPGEEAPPPGALHQPPSAKASAAAGATAQGARGGGGYAPGAPMYCGLLPGGPQGPPPGNFSLCGSDNMANEELQSLRANLAAELSAGSNYGRSLPSRQPQQSRHAGSPNGAALAAQIAASSSREARAQMAPFGQGPNFGPKFGLMGPSPKRPEMPFAQSHSSAVPSWRSPMGQPLRGTPAPAARPPMFTASSSPSVLPRPGDDEPGEESSDEDDDNEETGDSALAEIGSPDCPTLGSRGHTMRMCKPCAFVLKGCQSGQDCKFCHLCEVGEKKRRKKEKVAIRRELQKFRHNSGRQSNPSPKAPASAGSAGGASGNWRLGSFW